MSVLPGVRRSSSACVTTTKRSAGNMGIEGAMLEQQWIFSDVTGSKSICLCCTLSVESNLQAGCKRQ